ncbi:ESF1 (YDR365C) [Zygosaccharomyces parabailii]|nr:ESF1 (YDR365C) [Zygosaccharomyces parabailii]CDH14186.1 related to Pre-rRNA-processing protein ESF1 [Zygosaccharomyces bailii ISA1307]
MPGESDSQKSTDPRFAGIQDDPKFRNIKRKGLKVKLDDRFSKKDLEFRRKAKVDKYGRRLAGESKDLKDFDKYFEREEKEDDDKDDHENENENEERKGKKERSGSSSSSSSSSSSAQKDPKLLDRARGNVAVFSEEFTSSESEVSDESEEESEEEALEAAGQDKPEAGEPSKTLAVVNLDWDHVRASDLMITFSSFLPSGGKIEKICIYPSEFGKERMQREQVEGPPRELFRKKTKASKYDEDSDSDVNIHDLYEEGDADKEVDSKALRRYQLERLRYFYAIVYCNSVGAAEDIYSNCDGTEYESTANIFDLRYVPDSMSFDDKPHDECNELPKNYKPMQFSTDALQHSNVKLTWDETPVDRIEVSKRAFTQKELDDMDFKAYLASDSDESEEANNEEVRSKLKSLVGMPFDDSKTTAKGEEEPDMEITFTPGLDESQANANEHQEETTIEKVKRKEQERRKARKQKLKELKQKSEQEKRKQLKSVKGKKHDKGMDAKSRAELELLMMDDEGGNEKSLNNKAHFNMNEILKSEKEKTKKNKYQNKDKIVEDDFRPNLNDSRFDEVFENQEFAIDPSQPEYKGTKAMKEILQERSKRAHKKRRVSFDSRGEGKDGEGNISSIVKKLKRKDGNRKSKR